MKSNIQLLTDYNNHLVTNYYSKGANKPNPYEDELLSRMEPRQQAIDRYEFVRRLSPRNFSDLCLLNINTGKPFDELIDDLLLFRRNI